MEGRYPNGIMLVLTNCTDSSREKEFNDWFSNVYLTHVSASGTFHYPNRYRNTGDDLGPGEARYMTLLETDSEDLSASMREYLESVKGLIEKRGMHPAMGLVLTAIFRATGPQFRSGMEDRKTTGLMVLLANCKDEGRHREFNEWYDTVHIPHVIESRRYHTAYRYENVDPSAPEGRYLAIYETGDPDPGGLAALMAGERPQWIEKGLYSPDIERLLRAAYTKMGS